MTRLRQHVAEQDGLAMIMVVGLMIVLGVISITLIDVVVGETKRSSHAVTKQTAFQAAEAGIDDYTSKLVENHTYYQQYVAAGESTRTALTNTRTCTTYGAKVSSTPTTPTAWTYGTCWAYTSGKDNWRQLGNGYEYDLQITPQSGSSTISILATGRPQGDTNTADWRAIQTLIRPANLTDYYRIVNGDIGFSPITTTDGQVYANGNVTHDGIANANIYATGSITGSYSLGPGARVFPHSPPINFSQFLASLSDVKYAADHGGYDLNGSVAAWKIVFNSNGTFTYWPCTQSGSYIVESRTPNCSGSGTTQTVPSNGAIYTAQTAIVSGTVEGRVTIASNNNVDIYGNISYVTPGQDVLGLIAANDVYITKWAPTDLTWTAAVLVETGTWRACENGSATRLSDCTSGTHTHRTLTFRGSSTTGEGGDFSEFTVSHDFHYDKNLEYLAPPFFPSLSDTYTTLVFRELPPA